MNAYSRFTNEEIEQVSLRLSERNLQILKTLLKIRMASARQLEYLFFYAGTPLGAARQCRNELTRLTRLRLIARLDRRIGGVRSGSTGYVYSLDTLGQRLLQLQNTAGFRKPWTPSSLFVRHTLAVTELYVQLKLAERREQIKLAVFDSEPDCWRAFIGPGGGRQLLKPDATIRLSSNSYEFAWFVEIESATRTISAAARKLDAYRRYWQTGKEQKEYGLFPQVIFLAMQPERIQTLETVIRRQPTGSRRLFKIAPYDQAINVLKGDNNEIH